MAALKLAKVWINAFIHESIPGVTRGAPDTGTMVDGPPIPGGGGCYRTDNRDFSDDIGAPSRMHSEVEIAFEEGGPRITFQFHKCDTTHKIDCDSGESLCERNGDTSRMGFSNLRGSSTVDPQGGIIDDPNPNVVQIDLDDAANNPCVTSPDIDIVGVFQIDPVARSVRFKGTVEPFPAFEMYATGDNGAPVTMFRMMPREGATPFNLPGEPDRLVDVTVQV